MIKKILKYFFNFFFMSIYYYLLKNKVSKKLNPLADDILGSDKTIQRVLLNNFEFQTFDINTIYKSLENNLKNRKIKVEYLKFNHIDFEKYIKTSNEKSKNSYEQSLKKIRRECNKNKMKDIFYPLIDSIHKNYFKIWKNEFKENFSAHKNLYKEIKVFRKKSIELSKKFDVIIIPDTSYLYNHLLKQEFLKRGKKVYSLAPHNYFKYENIFVSEASPTYKKKNLDIFKKNKMEINNYLSKRFKGDSSHGFKSISFGENRKSNLNYNNKRILYLHSFTDANNNTWKYNQVFFSHIHWLDYTLSQLSKVNFKNWYIKLHPANIIASEKKIKKNSQTYGNKQIVEYFFKKYNVPVNVVKECPTNLVILKKKIPVFTNSSTIILETLCFGYKSFFSGPRFDDKFGIKAKSKEEWKKYLNQKNLKNILKVKNEQIIQAKYYLWKRFSNKYISAFAPDIHIYGWDSRFVRVKLAYKYFIKMMKS